MSLSARSHFNPVSRFHKCPCVLARSGGICLYVCSWCCTRIYVYVYDIHPLFPVYRLAEVGDSEGGPKRGGAREVGRENKLISLTQPAVTPPQHDINPKPRLSLFKLYESLRRRIGGTSWEAPSRVPLASPHSFDLIFPRW